MAEPHDDTPAEAALPCLALAQTLRRLGTLLRELSDAHFSECNVGVAGASSSIGAHVRHCLDHVQALLDGTRTGLVAYDRRERGTRVEHDRAVAIELLDRQLAEVAALDPGILHNPVQVETTVASDQPPITVSSSYARELAFVLSHSVHHHAVIGILAAALGYAVPADFLYAPATLAWMNRDACAPSP